MTERTPVVIDVDAVLDRVRFRGLPLTVLICSAVVLALDGFDIQVIGFVAPALTSEFGVTRAALGPVLAASLVGMAIGGLGVGPVGDRIGRRAAVLLSTAIFAVGTLLGSTAASIEALALWRLLTGIGLGGAMPNVTALMAEFAPPRWRSLTISAAIAGVPVGGMIGAALAAEIIPAFGWRAIFVLGGALPLAWFALMYFVLPESPRYLAARADRPHDLAALLNRIDRQSRFTGNETFVVRDASVGSAGKGVGALFSPELVHDTLLAWVIFGTNIFAVYAIFNWAPIVLTSLGLGLPTAVRGLLVFNLAGVVGALSLSLLIPRRGSRWLLAACAICAAASAAWLAWLTHSAGIGADLPVTALMTGLALAGFTTIAIQVGMFPVMAHVYPVQSRSTGVGWAIGLGRLGGILSSFAGGWFIVHMGGDSGFFAGVALTLAVTFVAVVALRNHIPPLRAFACVAMLVALLQPDAGLAREQADSVLRNGRIVTVDKGFRILEAIAIKESRIVAVGSDQQISQLIGESTRVIDLHGKSVIPGLVDSHLHATFGAANEFALSLNGVESIQDIQARIARRVAQVGRDEWIVASGDWHESQMKEGRLPNRRELDAVAPDNPVFIPRGGHVAIVNSRALALAGVDKSTRAPEGGVIVKDSSDELTGVLVEGSAVALVRRLLPTLTADERIRGLELYTAKLKKLGVTSIVDPGMTPPDLAAYSDLRQAGKLPIRVTALLFSRSLADLQKLAPMVTSFANDDRLRVAGFKAGLDGGIEGAYLHAPYKVVAGEQVDPAFRGKLLLPPGGAAEFEQMLLFAGRSKLQMQVHVVGDAALDQLLDSVSAVSSEVAPSELRWVAVHTFLPSALALERIKKLGLYVTVQDQPVSLGHNMVRYWGEERAARAIPIRSMLAANIPIGGGTDAPVVDPSPFLSLWWMVTRGTLPKGAALGAGEAIGREDALRLYTIGSARIARMEDRIGSLEPGKLADLVVLSEDFLSVPPERIRHLHSELTMVDGKVVHETK